MTYTPLPGSITPRTKTTISSGAPKGINNKDFKPTLKPETASILLNYYMPSANRLVKAPGTEKVFEITAGTGAGKPVTLAKVIREGFWIIGYSTVLSVYDVESDTVIAVKDDFATEDAFSGDRYGDYFYVCNGSTKIGYIVAEQAFDSQTTNFTVGQVVTGGASGATGVILSMVDAGATGTLTLGMIEGRFQAAEALTDPLGGDGNADGTIAFSFNEIADAPKAKVLRVVKTRLIAGNTDNDESEVHYSRTDQGTGVPWSAAADWTAATLPESPNTVTFKNGGAVVAIGVLGSQIVPLLDRGKIGFRISVIDVSGTGLQQDAPVDFENVDFGATRAVRVNSRGIFYANKFGIWQLISGGQDQVPFSSRDDKLNRLLGEKFLKQYDLSDADIEIDENRELLLVTCRKNSSTNNIILVGHLNLRTKERGIAWSTWQKNISRFFKIEDEIYGGTSNETKVVKFDYDFGSNEGEAMFTEFEQEVTVGNIDELKRLKRFEAGGRLSISSIIEIGFSTLDRKYKGEAGIPVNNAGDKKLIWTVDGIAIGLKGVGEAKVAEGAVGGWGDSDLDNLIDSFYGVKISSKDFLRVRVKFKSNDIYPHEINFFDLKTEPRGQVQTANPS